MLLKGVVSSLKNETNIETRMARIMFKNKDNSVSAFIKVALDVGPLQIGDNVLTAFFTDNTKDGIVIARYKEGD